MDEAVSRGIYFEIKYAPCLHSKTMILSLIITFFIHVTQQQIRLKRAAGILNWNEAFDSCAERAKYYHYKVSFCLTDINSLPVLKSFPSVYSGSETAAGLRGPFDAVNTGKSLHLNDSQVCKG